MRRVLGLALTIALGLTAVSVVAAVGHSTDDDCTHVRLWSGWDCLTDRELDRLRDRDRLTARDLRSMVDCECLSVSDLRSLDRVSRDLDRQGVKRVLRYLHRQDCVSDREVRRLRRGYRSIDADDVRTLIREARRCDRHDDRGWRRLDRWRELLERERSRRSDRGCIADEQVRRLARRAKDLDGSDIRAVLRLRDRSDDRLECVRARDLDRLDRRSTDLDRDAITWLLWGWG